MVGVADLDRLAEVKCGVGTQGQSRRTAVALSRLRLELAARTASLLFAETDVFEVEIDVPVDDTNDDAAVDANS